MVVVKLIFLILLASIVVNAAPVQDDLVMTTTDDDEVFMRESRSSNPTKRLNIPWHLDRIDQRQPALDGKYNGFANGKKCSQIVSYIVKIKLYGYMNAYIYTDN